jgi:hypothetical protein
MINFGMFSLLFVVVVLMVMWIRLIGLPGAIEEEVYEILHDIEDSGTPLPVYREEWKSLSYSGKNPRRVIALAIHLHRSLTDYKLNMALASAWYSQVKFLVKSGSILEAIVFWRQSKKSAVAALKKREYVPMMDRDPIDLEVIGAHWFILAKIPFFGKFFKAKALHFLLMATNEFETIKGPDNYSLARPLTQALISSKIFALTGEDQARQRVYKAGLTGEEDRGQLTRIAGHLGLASADDLLVFCVSQGGIE